VPLISSSPSENIPVSPLFFGEFDMLTARHFEKKTFVPSSTKLNRKPAKAALKPLGRPSFPGFGYELIRTLHDGLPYKEGRRATD